MPLIILLAAMTLFTGAAIDNSSPPVHKVVHEILDQP